jgi:hypothetical protein
MIEVCGADRVQLRDDVLEEIAGRLRGARDRQAGEYGEGSVERAAAPTAFALETDGVGAPAPG